MEALGMPIEKSEVGAPAVKIRVNIILLCHRSQLSIVKQPDGTRRLGNRAQFSLRAGTPPVNMFIKTIMKQVDAVASPGIGWTNPDAPPERQVRIGAPWHLRVARQTE